MASAKISAGARIALPVSSAGLFRDAVTRGHLKIGANARVFFYDPLIPAEILSAARKLVEES